MALELTPDGVGEGQVSPPPATSPAPFLPFRVIAPTVGTVDEDTEAVVVVDDSTDVARVTIDGVDAPDLRRLAGVVRFRVPGRASPGAATVEVIDTSGATLAAARFRWVAQGERRTPYFDAVAPKTGPIAGGYDVWIVGAGFVAGTTVTFGDATAPSVDVLSDSLLRVTAPAAARPGYVPVSIRTPDGDVACARSGFLYTRSQPSAQRTVRWDRREYVPPPGQGQLIVADVDRDGFSDLVVAGAGGVGTVRGLEHDRLRAPELFRPRPRSFYDTSGASRPVRCDLDGDGRLDVVGVSASDYVNEVWVVAFLGASSGRFEPWRSTSLPFGGTTHMHLVAPIDFDGDGDPDLLLADPYEVVAYRRVGAWRFERAGWTTLAPGEVTATTETVTHIVPLPLQPDRGPEVALGTHSGATGETIRVVSVEPGGALRLDPRAPRLAIGDPDVDPRPLLADVDADGVVDVVARCLNAPDLSPAERGSSHPPFSPSLYAVKALLRRPTSTDLAVFTRDARDELAVADVDGDGDLDLVTCWRDDGRELRVIEGPDWTVTRDLPSATAYVRDLAVGDLDLDGVNEIVRVEQGSTAVAVRSLRRSPDGSYADLGPTPIISSTDAVLSGPDLALWLEARAADAPRDLLLWTSQGPLLVTTGPDGRPEAPWSAGPAPGSSGAWIHGDLDGDGVVDLVTSSSDLRVLSWSRGRGDGRFEAPAVVSGSATTGFVPWAVVDVDRDGRPDVVGVARAGLGPLSARLGAAGPTFADVSPLPAAAQSPPPGEPTCWWVVAGDLDGDRTDDLFAANADRAAPYSSWTETLTGSPLVARLHSSSAVTQPAAIVDLDGDGRSDLLWSQPGRIRIDFGDGAGGFPRSFELPDPALVHPGSSPPAPIALPLTAADLDGDGAVDIVGVTGDGRVLMLLGHDAGWSPAVVLGVVGQSLAAVQAQLALRAEDLDGDGRAEVVVLAGGVVTIFRVSAD